MDQIYNSNDDFLIFVIIIVSMKKLIDYETNEFIINQLILKIQQIIKIILMKMNKKVYFKFFSKKMIIKMLIKKQITFWVWDVRKIYKQHFYSPTSNYSLNFYIIFFY